MKLKKVKMKVTNYSYYKGEILWTDSDVEHHQDQFGDWMIWVIKENRGLCYYTNNCYRCNLFGTCWNNIPARHVEIL